jgi:hypothetical protein
MDNNNEQPRKRGRPRKNQIMEKTYKREVKHNIFNQEKEIILHMPLLLKDLDENNKDNNFDINENSDKSMSNNNVLLTLSDDEQFNYNKNYYDILNDLQEKDKLIRQLKDEILEYNSVLTEYNNSNEKSNININLKIPLINYNNGNMIVPEKTNICCWWCTYNFDNIPIYIPEIFHNNTYYVFGCFCSFNCAASYNLNMNDYKVKERFSLLMNIALSIYKKDITFDFIVAPQKEILDKYGGPITINEFRKNFKSCTKEYRLVIPPMSSIIPSVEIIIKDKLYHKYDTNKFSQVEDNKNDIFGSMGLTIKKK